MRNRLFFIILLFFAVVSLQPARAADAVSKDDWQVTDLHKLITQHKAWLNTSRPLTPDDLKGRIILLDFWTYCCINCMHVIPDLEYLEQKFGPDLTVIGVHSAKFKNEGDSENIRSAILRYGITHPVVNDSDFAVWNGFGVHAWPTFVLINPKGAVEGTYSGEGNRAAVEHDIEALRTKYAGAIVNAPLPIALEKDKVPDTLLKFPAKIAVGTQCLGCGAGKDTTMPSNQPVQMQPMLWVSDSGHNRIVGMTLAGAINRVIGSGQEGFKDGSFEEAQFHHPQGILASADGAYLYVADTENHALRRIDLKNNSVTTLAGNGTQGTQRDVVEADAATARLSSPWDLAFYPDDKHIVIAMAGLHQLWSYDIDKKTLNTIAGSGNENIEDGAYPANALAQTSGLSVYNGRLYFVDAETSSLRMLDNGKVKTWIGTGLFDFGFKDGVQGTAKLQHPLGLYAGPEGIFIADSYNHSIRRFDLVSGELSTYAGHGERGDKDGKLADASFNEPNAIAKLGDHFYVADTNNNAIRVIDVKAQTVSTLKLTPPEEKAEPASLLSTNLPNLEKTEPAAIAATGAQVKLQLQKGWHINDEAPSLFTLFEMDKTPKTAATFEQPALKMKRLILPMLTPGASYRLQGTAYFCADKAGSQCLIKSFDQELTARPGGKKELALKLN